MKRGKSPDTQKALPQSERFIEVARMIGCDESEERFDAALKKVAASPPPPKDKASSKKPGK